MQKDRENKEKLISFIGWVVFTMTLLGVVYTIYDLKSSNDDLVDQIEQRDSLITQTRKADSILLAQSIQNKSVVEKYISDCGIKINGRNVSTDELVSYLNKQLKDINSLNDKIFALQDTIFILKSNVRDEQIRYSNLKISDFKNRDSLRLYRLMLDMAKKNYGVDYTVKNTDSNRTTITIQARLKAENDSLKSVLQKFQKLYELVQRDYGIQYNVEEKNEMFYFNKITTKADSGLVLFKYYKDKLSTDTAGNWIITLPRRWKMPK